MNTPRSDLMSLDPHRPSYHFTPDQWMNDPIPFFHRGEYHVFYQHNPHGAYWGTMHWGHAVSCDLVHWTEVPVALAPTSGGPDQDGCWTGCAVAAGPGGPGGHPFQILYTGIPRLEPLRQVQCLAGSADLLTWEKHPDNPVIAEPPPGFGGCFRDPCAWREEDAWYMLIGSEQPERKGGAALLYRSEDMVRWQYMHPFFLGRAEETGHDFECPDLFPLGDQHVLLASRGQTSWHLGRSSDQRFTRERWGVVDGGALYAAKTLVDDRGRRLLWGWIRENRMEEEQRAAGWSGVLSLPRLLTLRPDGSVGMEPAPELQALRGRHHHFTDLTITGDRPLLLDGVTTAAAEVQVRFAPADVSTYGVGVRCTPDGRERTEIVYDPVTRRLGSAPLDLAGGEELVLRIYVDHSVIEAFANGRACHTLRCYPERADARGIGLIARGGPVGVQSVDIWELQPGLGECERR